MKYLRYFRFLLFFVLTTTSCEKDSGKTGTVTFGANYHIINCITNITVFIDGEKVGMIEMPSDSVIDCGISGYLNKDVSIGNHSYKVEIRPEMGAGCTKDIKGTFRIHENECKKIFIDYTKIDF